MANGAILHVEGLRDLHRAFGLASAELQSDLRDALEESAAPVRNDAMALAGAILPPGDPWARFRSGVDRRVFSAYVAPVERGVKGRGNQRKRRPDFDEYLGGRSLQPAFQRNAGRIEQRFNQLLGEVATVWDRA